MSVKISSVNSVGLLKDRGGLKSPKKPLDLDISFSRLKFNGLEWEKALFSAVCHRAFIDGIPKRDILTARINVTIEFSCSSINNDIEKEEEEY